LTHVTPITTSPPPTRPHYTIHRRTCYFWLPLWGVTCSLLYLSRTHSKRQDKKGAGGTDTTTALDSGFLNPLINSVDHSNHYFFGAAEGAYNNYNYAADSNINEFDADSASQSPRSRPDSRNNKQFVSSFDSCDPSLQYSPHYLTTQDAILRLDSSTVYGSDGQLSGHTDVLYTENDTDTDINDNEAMFGAVFSPDNSLHMYRDSSMFSPAVSTMHHMSPKDMRFSST